MRGVVAVNRSKRGVTPFALALVLACGLAVPRADDPPARCYPTWDGSLTICHHPYDGGDWAQPPISRIVYDSSVIEWPGRGWTVIHHAEPQRSTLVPTIGDSVRFVLMPNWSYLLPQNTRVYLAGTSAACCSPLFHGTDAQPTASGGGNPAPIGGPDGRLYALAVAVVAEPAGQRHAWVLTRTDGSAPSEVWTGTAWVRMGPLVRPAVLRDVTGAPIMGRAAGDSHTSTGLIASLVNLGGHTWAYYVDCSDGACTNFHLYARWTRDVSDPGGSPWSAPIVVSPALTQPMIVRVAMARAPLERLAVLWTCWRTDGTSDLCLEYTRTTDPLSVSEVPIRPVSGSALHMFQGNGLRAQPALMKDWCGRLTIPPVEQDQPTRAGFVTWMDLPNGASPYGRPSFRAGWYVTPATP